MLRVAISHAMADFTEAESRRKRHLERKRLRERQSRQLETAQRREERLLFGLLRRRVRDRVRLLFSLCHWVGRKRSLKKEKRAAWLYETNCCHHFNLATPSCRIVVRPGKVDC